MFNSGLAMYTCGFGNQMCISCANFSLRLVRLRAACGLCEKSQSDGPTTQLSHFYPLDTFSESTTIVGKAFLHPRGSFFFE